MLKLIRTTLAFCGVTLASLAYAGSDLGGQGTVTDEQIEKISKYICFQFDRYKTDDKSIKKANVSSCKAPYEFVCQGEGEYLSMVGIVRAGINKTLKINSATEFENSIPHVVSQLMTHSCYKPSMHYAVNTPFLKQRRNFAKRAIFLGNAGYLFDEFIFKEYIYEVNGKIKPVIDINAIEMVDGEPETLLDYLDKIVERGHASRLGGSGWNDLSGGSGYAPGTSLRSVLPALGAVNAIDLDCEPGQRTGCKVKRRIDRDACEKHCLIDMGTKTEESEGRKVTYRNKVVDTVCFSQCAVRGEFVPPDIDWTKRYGGFLRPENIEWQSQ
ncbi:MAG: hypothetical protein EVA65_10090 [Oceanococcus sp.]|nr:MAG: hypothetical protein EVA65_10090 [Oceanococcus sp.]